MTSPNNWIAFVKSLPASLGFIFIIDWNLGSSLVDLYKAQMEKSDEYKLMTLIAFMVLVGVNLVIISFFAKAKLLEDKQSRLGTADSSEATVVEAKKQTKPKTTRKKALDEESKATVPE